MSIENNAIVMQVQSLPETCIEELGDRFEHTSSSGIAETFYESPDQQSYVSIRTDSNFQGGVISNAEDLETGVEDPGVLAAILQSAGFSISRTDIFTEDTYATSDGGVQMTFRQIEDRGNFLTLVYKEKHADAQSVLRAFVASELASSITFGEELTRG